jgi:hypothetical protein
VDAALVALRHQRCEHRGDKAQVLFQASSTVARILCSGREGASAD